MPAGVGYGRGPNKKVREARKRDKLRAAQTKRTGGGAPNFSMKDALIKAEHEVGMDFREERAKEQSRGRQYPEKAIRERDRSKKGDNPFKKAIMKKAYKEK